ncbi:MULTISPECIES: VIT1/CCC1 transporter family protein [Flammeovirga]|uniref:VIT family protein n=1 Tax=Flammeovirga agarivorans TaxID=2726742 RepID=A0A7X8XUY3_9BACT|nr:MULTISPECIES: VIT1/CCC1 transporter family protein [Flammeovirga]NLR90545.1 hypothetical protein [Flammeovirga agarivorans]
MNRKEVILQRIQPALAGLTDGTISSLAPIFATAFSTHNSWNTFIVGLATSIGAGISMTFSEYLSDDGNISGRGNPLKRGLITGAMTATGGLGHTIPFLFKDFSEALVIALIIVLIELSVIVWLRKNYLQASIKQSVIQIVIGGCIVLSVGVLLGQM